MTLNISGDEFRTVCSDRRQNRSMKMEVVEQLLVSGQKYEDNENLDGQVVYSSFVETVEGI